MSDFRTWISSYIWSIIRACFRSFEFVSSCSRMGKEWEPGERRGWRGQYDKRGEDEKCELNEVWKRGGGSRNVKMWTIIHRKMGDTCKSQRYWRLWEARDSFPRSSPPPFPISFPIRVQLCLQDMYVYIISWIKAAFWLAHFCKLLDVTIDNFFLLYY